MQKVLLLFLIFLSGSAIAQVINIENRRANDGTYGFSGVIDMTLSAQQQKDLLLTVQFKPLIQFKFNKFKDFVYRKDQDSARLTQDKNKHMLLLINDLKYTRGRETYANFGMSHLRYAYRIANTGWKWESYTQIQYNQLLLQKVRTLIGTGLRAKIADIKPVEGKYNKRAVRAFLGSSLYYEYEEINYSFQPMEYINSVRWNTYLSTYMNFKFLEFISSTYIQPNLARFKDYRFLGDYSVLFRISEPFSIKINYNHFFDAEPPETVNPHTFSVSFGFIYRLDNFKIDPEKWKRKKEEQLPIE